LGFAVENRLTELPGLVGIVDPNGIGVGAEVDDLVLRERLEDNLTEVDSAVIEGDRDFHSWTVPRMAGDGCAAAPRARPAVPRRLDPLCCSREVGPSHFGDVGRGPDGGARREPLPLRLRRSEAGGERPPDLLQGSRVDAA